MNVKRLFLIDGSALFYRSYFAFIRNPLINSKGENTSATYGVALYLMKILFEEKPDYLGMVFDTKEPTFRHHLYPEYKATREKMPEEMAGQYPRVVELSRAFDIPVLEMAGYEADDIIATLAKRAEQQGIETYMATSDKDMMQILSPQIKMYNMRPGYGKDAAEIIDEAHLKEKFGLRPEQIVDYLALMGDKSDNVPGIPKVGEKTAQSLLREYGSIEGIYANLDKISKKSIHDNLAENRALADLSRELVTLETKVPVEIDWKSLQLSPVNPEKIVPLFEELEFRSLITRIREAGSAAGTIPAPEVFDSGKQNYQLVNTAEGLKKLTEQLKNGDFFVFDTETTGLGTFNADVIGVSFSGKKKEAYYVPLNDSRHGLTAETVLYTLKPVFENPNIKKGGQNIKFDALMLSRHGIELQGIHFDTMVAGYLITPGARQNNLEALAEKYLGYKMIPIEDLIGKKGKKQKTMADVAVDEVSTYACEDADITYQLKLVLEKRLKETGTEDLFNTVEMPLVQVLLHMEKSGVSLDVDFLKQMSKQLGEGAVQLQKEVYELAGEEFNLNSPQQLGVILFDKLEIHKELGRRRPQRTPTGQYSTSEAVLLKYSAHPVVNKILDYRKLVKLKSTYVDALPLLISPRTHRLHTSFNQTIAATGRLSSSDPNLQNIPIRGELGREIRKAFIPADPGSYILSADYSQVELRVMAHISGDEGLKEAFARGEDIHSSTAAAIFDIPIPEVTPDQRRKAKEVNFGIIYGISRYGLADRLGISSDEAETIIQNYFARFPKVNQYMIDTIAFARENKYVTTLLNRRRYLPEIANKNMNIRQNAERAAINTTIQGSAADLIKLAMISIYRDLKERKLQSKMILQVHDELVFEVPEKEGETVKELVKTRMESAMELSVPLKVDVGVGKNWLEAH
jgi:DNA polymerase-1